MRPHPLLKGVTLIRLMVLFFLSGAAGLIYEVVWARLFADILGSTALSMTSVFSVFLLALALGAYLFGRVPVYGKAALVLYGWLEIGVGLSALLISSLLVFGRTWIAVHLPTSDRFVTVLFLNLLVTALLIGVPTLLMGGTLPVVLNAAREWTLPRRVVAQFYGWNTLGAACGTFAAGFFLIWKLGLIMTLSVAISLNLLVGLAALLLAHRARAEDPAPPPPEKEETPVVSPVQDHLLWPALAFLSGFSVLGYEILWGRMAKFLLGDRTIAITSLLFVFITCLGLGSLVAPTLGRRFGADTPRQALKLISWIFLVAALLHLLFVPLASSTIGGDGLVPILPIPNEFVRRILTVWVLVFPPVLVLGLVFPLLAWSAREINVLPGRVMGNLYLVNTIGGALGAVIASFALSRWMGTLGGFLAFTGLLAVSSALLLLARSGRRWQQAVAFLAIGGFVLTGYRFPDSLAQLREDEVLLVANEDEYGVQVLTFTQQQRMRVRNNRLSLIYDLGHPQTTHAQQMAAHLTVLLAGECCDVLNIGTGYGITAGTFTLYQDVRSIETIEILPFLVKQQHRFATHNFDYLSDPRVTLAQADGRHHLVTSPRTYDIISVNVLDPYLPGSSSLYTVDFWEVVRDHLRPGGVYTQLFWGKDTPLLVKGLRTVFPTVLYFPAYGGTSVNVVAFKEAVTEPDLHLHLERFGPEATREVWKIASLDPGLLFPNLIRRAWVTRRKLEDLAATTPGRLHTDDFPILEFRWAHGVRHVSILDSPLVAE